MISNKTISIAAVGFAAANAIKIQAKVEAEDIFDDIANWTVGAANDIADWTVGAVNDAADWTEQAFTDAGNWTANAFTDAYDWVKEPGNWVATFDNIGKAMVTGFSGDWEDGWDIFTDSSNYYEGSNVHVDRCSTETTDGFHCEDPQKEYEEAMRKQQEFCAKNEPKVGQPMTPGGFYNYTQDFNY